MTYETAMRQSFNGWRAETSHVLETLANGSQRVLELSTSKTSRGGAISSFASVSIIARHTKTHAIFGDYAKTVHQEPCARVTEKALRAAHDRALVNFPNVIAEAQAFYEEKDLETARETLNAKAAG